MSGEATLGGGKEEILVGHIGADERRFGTLAHLVQSGIHHQGGCIHGILIGKIVEIVALHLRAGRMLAENVGDGDTLFLVLGQTDDGLFVVGHFHFVTFRRIDRFCDASENGAYFGFDLIHVNVAYDDNAL